MAKKEEKLRIPFSLVVGRFFQKVEALEDKDAQALIKNVIQYIRDTGSTCYVSYKPDVIALMEKYWQFFSVCSEEWEKGFWCYNFCSFSSYEEADKAFRGVWSFSSNFVAYLSGNPEKVVEEVAYKDERDWIRFLAGKDPDVEAFDSFKYLVKYCEGKRFSCKKKGCLFSGNDGCLFEKICCNPAAVPSDVFNKVTGNFEAIVEEKACREGAVLMNALFGIGGRLEDEV